MLNHRNALMMHFGIFILKFGISVTEKTPSHKIILR